MVKVSYEIVLDSMISHGIGWNRMRSYGIIRYGLQLCGIDV
jgi:hypothetical protein